MIKQYLTLFGALIFSSISFAWGAKGHQIVAHVGADLVTQGQPFWRSNLEPILNLSTVPDRVWKSANTKSAEGPTHFFEIDTYYSESDFDEIPNFPSSYVEAIQKYTESRVVENGTAPWRVRQLYRLALQALRAGDMKKALQYVGTMSHYVADLSQPLHVSENYDGQLSGNKGIHKFFETDIISDEFKIRTDVKKRAQKLLQSRSFLKQFETQLMGTILREVQRSISFEDEVLKTDDQFGRGQKGAAAQLNLAKDRLADGAAVFSIILSRLWADSGLVARATPLTVKDPKWVRPDFQQLDFSPRATSIENEFMKDDCSQ